MATTYEVDVQVRAPEAARASRRIADALRRSGFSIDDVAPPAAVDVLAVVIQLDAADASVAERRVADALLDAARDAGISLSESDLDLDVRTSS